MKTLLYPLALGTLLWVFPAASWGQAGSCTVVSAVLQWATDDEGYIYINGQSPVSCWWSICWEGADDRQYHHEPGRSPDDMQRELWKLLQHRLR